MFVMRIFEKLFGQARREPGPANGKRLSSPIAPAVAGEVGGAKEYAVAYEHNLPNSIPASTRQVGWLSVRNLGTRAWHPTPVREGEGPVEIVLYLDDEYHSTLALPKVVEPGAQATIHWYYGSPREIGHHEYRFELVHHHVTWFAERGVEPLRVPCEVTSEPPTASARLLDRSEEAGALNWWTGIGVSWSRFGPAYPVMARAATGCRLTDVEGREFLDYVMGHGCALLGYAHPRIQQAVSRALASGAVLSLMHELEVEVSEMIAAAIPGAERVLFGKNGSDACTAAVRLARVHTGRPVVLTCGYHGWQDWFAARGGFESTGVPTSGEPLVASFAFNDIASVERLFEVYPGKVAAVMIEPAAPIESYAAPLQDADADFLRELASLARRNGSLLIFDEIVTGFRYPAGSVQGATGVIPDLTCLGKGLSAGMPLAAMAGRREIFGSSIDRIGYGPTFKGETYSLAAAREALTIYRESDVPGHIDRFAQRLRSAIDQVCRSLDVPARVTGPSFRMGLTIDEPDPVRRRLLRTLLHQELMRNGVLSNMGYFLPSFAHGDDELAPTTDAVERALATVAEASRDDRFASRLEISPVHD